MAIEKIKYVYDHIQFFRMALIPVINQFFMRLRKEQQIETTKNIQKKLAKKCCRSRKAIFATSKYVQRNLFQKATICYRLS